MSHTVCAASKEERRSPREPYGVLQSGLRQRLGVLANLAIWPARSPRLICVRPPAGRPGRPGRQPPGPGSTTGGRSALPRLATPCRAHPPVVSLLRRTTPSRPTPASVAAAAAVIHWRGRRPLRGALHPVSPGSPALRNPRGVGGAAQPQPPPQGWGCNGTVGGPAPTSVAPRAPRPAHKQKKLQLRTSRAPYPSAYGPRAKLGRRVELGLDRMGGTTTWLALGWR